ncbi:MAG: prenyltransferase/squalene oxidase repeat-containing protein [Myxococcota bacterium]
MQSAADVLARGTRRLVDLQLDPRDGETRPERSDLPNKYWEGEDIWNSMLAAQFALAWHIMERPLSKERRERILTQFRHEQLPGGLWGMHRFGEPSLFVTTLVYVASRTLGVSANDPFLAPARAFFAQEDVLEIPSWGKAWLALTNLYEWWGVNAVPPEAWLLPERFPLHPANYYCHTRLIYMGMASVFGLKLQARRTALTDELRDELYPGRDYRRLDFAGSRHALRKGDLWAAPTRALRTMYNAVNVFERFHAPALRRRCLKTLRERMRWELRSSDYTCLSPVNGLLFMLTLWAWDKHDEVLQKQVARFDGWIWEDDEEGLRVCGARSATWDTSFVLQALSAARPSLPKGAADDALVSGLGWLKTQQMHGPVTGDKDDYKKAYRLDPTGGFCFAGVWHGWPVSDCTAEALCAFLEAPRDLFQADRHAVEAGIRFLLQCQNKDGGFGSYESRKTHVNLEWMNPAEMFGDSMTELSYYECTASNLIALAEVRKRYPNLLRREIDRAIERAETYLRQSQNADGSWNGAWGVAFLYGTLFGIRGLRAAGALENDPAIESARAFVRKHQREDGSWGEHWRTCLTDRYEDLGHGHVVQTAWALLALLESGEDDASVLEPAMRWLSDAQLPNGDWSEQEFAGVFFRTALIEYRLYRRIFPVWALAQYEALRATREKAHPKTAPIAPSTLKEHHVRS